MCFFRKKKKKNTNIKTSDAIIMEQIMKSDDEHILELSNKMIEGNPLILNFENIDIDAANKIISFISGVVYAIEGFIFEINTTTYLFGNKHLYDDNSVKEFLDSL